MPTSVIVTCVDTTVQSIQLKTELLIECIIACIIKYGVWFFWTGSFVTSCRILLRWNLVRAANTRCFAKVVMPVIEIVRQSRAFRDWLCVSMWALVCSMCLECSWQQRWKVCCPIWQWCVSRNVSVLDAHFKTWVRFFSLIESKLYAGYFGRNYWQFLLLEFETYM
jgi:hypothetical protein